MASRQPTAFFALAIVAATALVGAQSEGRATIMLETGIQKELVDGDLPGAVAVFNIILNRFGDEPGVASQALWHLGQSYEQMGDPQARKVYERLLRDYADQKALLSGARARLSALMEAPAGVDPVRVVVRDLASRPTSPVATGPNGNGNLLVFSDLAVHNVSTGESRRLTASARSTAYPVPSPDGRRVAYLSWSGDLLERRRLRGDQSPGRSEAELRIVGVDGSADRLVLRSNGVPWLRPYAWSPDGRQILAVFERADGSTEIALVSVADGSTRILKSLQWRSPQGMGFSPDGQYIAYEIPMPRDSGQLEMVVLPIEPGRQSPSTERRYAMSLGGQATALASNTQAAIHVLNRLSFGPRLGDIERVVSMGVDAYIDEQLNPQRIADPVVQQRLAGFVALRSDIPELLANSGPVSPIAHRRRATVFERRAAADGAPGAPPTLESDPLPVGEAAQREMFGDRPADFEIQTARLFRAIYSERQLNEVMVDFWMNHFNVNLSDHQLAPHFEEAAIRRHTLGSFEELLMAVAKHPRMLFYLDNWRSSAPAEVVQKRVADLKTTLTGDAYLALLARTLQTSRRPLPFLTEAKGLNENFARELMELHTMGVDSGYTQQDVIEVAKVLTGWTISGQGLVNGREDDGVFAFDPILHVEGDKTVLGRVIKSGGVEEGEQLLKMLAHHPATARFVATKLARRFVADDPPAAVVDAAARTFEQTGGNIREVLRTIFMSPQFRSPAAYRAKIKKPIELVVSAMRAVKADATGPYSTLLGGGNRGILARMGEKVYNYEAPDGNPDVGGAWMNSNALLVRLDFANALAANRIPGVKSDVGSAQRLLEQLGLPRPTPAQIEQTRGMFKTSRVASAASMSMMMGSGPASADAEAPIDPAAIVVATMLGSPQFQKR